MFVTCSTRGKFCVIHIYRYHKNRASIYVSDGEHVLINGNTIIEEHFGCYGMLCTADLIDALYNGSEHSDDILTRLGPLKLSNISRNDRFVFVSTLLIN